MATKTDPFITISDSVKKQLGEIVSLNATVKEREATISELTAKNAQLKISLDKANREISSLKTTSSELSSKNDELAGQLEQANAGIAALQSEIEELNNKVAEQKRQE